MNNSIKNTNLTINLNEIKNISYFSKNKSKYFIFIATVIISITSRYSLSLLLQNNLINRFHSPGISIFMKNFIRMVTIKSLKLNFSVSIRVHSLKNLVSQIYNLSLKIIPCKKIHLYKRRSETI